MMKCPVCGSSDDKHLVEQVQDYRIYRCPSCTVVFADPMKTPGADWYEKSDDYRMERLLHFGTSWNNDMFLKRRTMPGNSILDVGCGMCTFLSKAQSIGYRVTGIDFDSRTLEAVKKRFNLSDLHQADLSLFIKNNPGRKFDVVTFFDVLEHLEDPVGFLG